MFKPDVTLLLVVAGGVLFCVLLSLIIVLRLRSQSAVIRWATALLISFVVSIPWAVGAHHLSWLAIDREFGCFVDEFGLEPTLETDHFIEYRTEDTVTREKMMLRRWRFELAWPEYGLWGVISSVFAATTALMIHVIWMWVRRGTPHSSGAP